MVPDYDLAPTVNADTPRQLKAVAEPVRSLILDLVLERAATVTELAVALDRPKSSVAYHVDVLVDVGLLQVVRTRKVRAIEERFYGRTGRTIIFGDSPTPIGAVQQNFLAAAQSEATVSESRRMRSTLRHARIPDDRAEELSLASLRRPKSSPRCLVTAMWSSASLPPSTPPTTLCFRSRRDRRRVDPHSQRTRPRPPRAELRQALLGEHDLEPRRRHRHHRLPVVGIGGHPQSAADLPRRGGAATPVAAVQPACWCDHRSPRPQAADGRVEARSARSSRSASRSSSWAARVVCRVPMSSPTRPR